ncbi:MAG: bifunctional 5,10-methylenetetrahydrofolate dehydrogenase/5,10-methenyltetrahydrofolate cyclohydrolase [Bdellovibrionota bacterium]
MLQLKGKPVAESIYSQIKAKLGAMLNAGMRSPHLAVILVGEDPASKVYVAHKQKACETLGFKSSFIKLSETTSDAELAQKIDELNTNDDIDGILLQLPLPSHLDAKKMSDLILPSKDADSLTATSLGLLMSGRQVVSSCTPAGIIEILKYYKLSVANKNVLVIGRSLIVGLPLFHLLTQENATVTVAHSKTENLKELVKNFDFVFVAVGKPHFLKATDFKKDTVVIDVGIHRVLSGLIGDVDPTGAETHLKALSPVPGGVGPMTIAMLMKNTYSLTEKKHH